MKKELSLGLIILLLIVVVASAYVILMGVSKTSQGGDVKFITLRQGVFSEISSERTVVLRNNEEFLSLWNEMFPVLPTPPAPVDFDSRMVVAVFAGERPSGGYGLEIKEIINNEDFLLVKVTESIPGESCIVTTALTSPYHVVEINRIDKRVDFLIETQVVDC